MIITLVTLTAMIVAMATRRFSPAASVLGALAVLFLTGVVDAAEAFAGFSNPAPLTIAGLYVVAAGVFRTGALEPVFRRLLSDGGRGILLRVVLSAGIGSAFLANTPIVALSIPRIRKWAGTSGASLSKFLIPVSYAAILGGTLTVIGTSTNLIVSGLLEEAGEEAIGFFEMAQVGLPLFVVGLAVTLIIGPRVLPVRDQPQLTDAGRPFTVSMIVDASGPLPGRAVGAAGLRNLSAVYLVEIERRGRMIAPIAPGFVLEGGDRLVFAGNVDQIVDLQATAGLVSAEGPHMADLSEGELFEVVVGPNSPIAGRTLKGVGFRARYQAAVIGIHRSGERLGGKLGQIEIRPGDTLLVLAGGDFGARYRDRSDFLLVSRFDGELPPSTSKAPRALLALALVVLLPALGLSTVLWSTVLGVVVLVGTGVVTPAEARESISLGVVLIIAAAFGIGAAVESSGLAGSITDFLASLGGTVAPVIGVLLATMVLTELITNAAAVALMFPIATELSTGAGVEPRLMILAMGAAASLSFLTPIGYQTNTMVYGPGGYRFTDYLRLGIPLSLASMATLLVVVLA